MNTPAITNPASLSSLSSSGAAGAKPSALVSGVSFDQTLTREMAERGNAGEPARATQKEGTMASQGTKAPQADRTGKADAPDTAQAPAGEDAAEAEPATQSAAAATNDDKAGALSASPDDDNTADNTVAADDLLALVASLNQAGAVMAPAQSAQPAQPALDAAANAAAAQTLIPAAANAPAAAVQALPATGAGTGADSVEGAATHKTRSSKASIDVAGMQPGSRKTEFGSALSQAKDAADDKNTKSARQAEDGKPASGADAGLPRAARDSATEQTEEQTAPGSDLRTAHGAKDAQPAVPGLAPANVDAAHGHAPLQQVQAASAHAAGQLAPRVGAEGWDQAFGQKVVWMATGSQQSASLTLNPPDLGPLQVELNVSNSQATAHFTAAQPEVRQALEAAMPRLREMLGEAGIQLGQANVSAGTPGQQHAFAGRQAQPGAGGRAAADGVDDAEAAPRSGVSRVRAGAGRLGMVDTFA